MDYKLPWERPKIAMIISIFGGKVTEVKNDNTTHKTVGGDNDDIQR